MSSPDPHRTVLLAAPRSFCAGVERAIDIVDLALQQRGAPVYVRKQIVHNTHVVSELQQRGARFVDELEEVPRKATVVFAAHGVAPQVWQAARERELDVIDATCPLVTKVHAEARRFADRGDTVVLIGHAGHEEVDGTMGEVPGMLLVETVADVEAMVVDDDRKIAYLTQTTLAVDETEAIIAALRRRFPHIQGPGSDDICYATSNRQAALTEVAGEADLVLVVGSSNSSNSIRLTEVARRAGVPAYLIEDADQLDPAWLEDVAVVGITAGASAPPWLVESLLDRLRRRGPVTVTERVTVTESTTFALPLAVRSQAVAGR